MDKVSMLVYSVRNTGTKADAVREFILDKYGIESYIALHPNRLIIRLSTPVNPKDMKDLDRFIRENLDGKLLEEH